MFRIKPLGRLFWKFFFAFWLAVLTAGVGVGSFVWWRHQDREQDREQRPVLDLRHAASAMPVAEAVLRHAGLDGLRAFLQDWDNSPFPKIYAVDEQDRELLARPIAVEALDQARALYAAGNDTGAIRLMTGEDGHRYLLFVPAGRPHGPREAPGFLPFPDKPPHHHDHEDGPVPHDPAHHGPHDKRPEPPSPVLPWTVGGAASVLFSVLLAGYFARPIRRLRQAFAELAAGKLDTRVGAGMGWRRDELADLGRDFDHMADHIGALVSAQQRLLHDVSHELRSPLARMQAAIGLAQQQPDKTSMILERIERESQRISDLVGELLELSRLESGVTAQRKDLLDLGNLLSEIVEDARFEAQTRQIAIDYRDLDSGSVAGYRELLRRAVENVLRNAVQHCPVGGRVEVSADFDAARCLHLRVDDQGPGVSEQELPSLFQPFFRCAAHRNQTGTGLGLAIAQRAVAVHGGEIRACNRQQGGLRIDIRIPFGSEI